MGLCLLSAAFGMYSFLFGALRNDHCRKLQNITVKKLHQRVWCFDSQIFMFRPSRTVDLYPCEFWLLRLLIVHQNHVRNNSTLKDGKTLHMTHINDDMLRVENFCCVSVCSIYCLPAMCLSGVWLLTICSLLYVCMSTVWLHCWFSICCLFTSSPSSLSFSCLLDVCCLSVFYRLYVCCLLFIFCLHFIGCFYAVFVWFMPSLCLLSVCLLSDVRCLPDGSLSAVCLSAVCLSLVHLSTVCLQYVV